MPEIRDIAQEYHDAYCAASGLKVKYTMALYSDWYLFSKDFEPSDLGTVIRYLRRIYRDKPEILRACIRLPKLIQDRTLFASYLAEAEQDERVQAANARAPKKTERERLLDRTCTGQRPAGDSPPQKVSEVALEVLRKFKQDLNPGSAGKTRLTGGEKSEPHRQP